MKVLVLGGGVIGVTTAWYLRRAGCEVVLVERNARVAAETSHANGGQLSVSHAEPWARPGTPWQILRWLGDPDAPLRLRLRRDPALWRWLLRFLAECLPGRSEANIRSLVALGLHSREALRALRSELDLDYAARGGGILHIYTDAAEFARARRPAQLMSELGCERRVLSVDEAVALEPALALRRDALAGATWAPEDSSGDACRFTEALAAHAAAAGVALRLGQRIEALEARDGRIAQVRVRDADGAAGHLRADAYVVALGSYSPLLLRPLGLRLAVYPAKGYSLTLPVQDPARAWTLPLIDDAYKLVFSRLGDALRIAGMAELGGYDLSLDPARCAILSRRTEQLFPGAGDAQRARFWTGLRPSTPSNVPYLGRSRISNLWLNTGHGTLGWTHACGSAQLLAQWIASNRRPALAFPFVDG